MTTITPHPYASIARARVPDSLPPQVTASLFSVTLRSAVALLLAVAVLLAVSLLAIVPLLAVASLLPKEANAQQTAFKPLTPGFETKFKIDKKFIPGKGRIAFTAHIDGFERILVLDLDQRRVRPAVDGPGNNTYPSFSPDGSKLLFVSDRSGVRRIYLSEDDGTQVRRLTTATFAEDYPSWAPDGKSILFVESTSGDAKAESHLFSVSSEGGAPTRIATLTGRTLTPRYSPDQRMISYNTNRFWPGWSICLLTLADRQGSCPLAAESTFFSRAQWSPDGRSLLFSVGDRLKVDLGLYDIATKTQSTLTNLPGREYDASFVGKSGVVFAAEARPEQFELLSLDTKKSDRPGVLLKAPFSLRYPSWTRVTTLESEVRRAKQLEAHNDARGAGSPPPPPTPPSTQGH